MSTEEATEMRAAIDRLEEVVGAMERLLFASDERVEHVELHLGLPTD